MVDSAAVLERNLAGVRRRIEAAAGRSGREPGDVTVVAVAKGIPPDRVRWAVGAGIRDVGENYVNELAETRTELRGGGAATRWHDVVHTVGSVHAATRLSGRAERGGRRLPVLIEVDFAGRRTGVPPDDAPRLADEVRPLGGVELRGLMTVPPMTESPEDARPYFARLRTLRDRLGDDLVDLSMGMSADYEVAVEEGATMIRIGTALFGDRPAAE